jgi:GNAT superfamily N-acetyltransferase
MPSITVEDMNTPDEEFVATCSHVGESEEIDACAEKRLNWFRRHYEQGLRIKVAHLDGKPVGFLYVMPIEISPWGPMGKELMVVPCLFVIDKAKGKGAGAALLAAAEAEAKTQGHKGICVVAYYHDFWFMPAAFFEKLGYTAADRHLKEALMWKTFDSGVEPPKLMNPKYEFHPQEDKVVIDLFYNDFCSTCGIESDRVREVAAEFGDSVVLREYNADNRESLCRCQNSRGIFVNGKEIGWGYEAPREGIREAIQKALPPAT